MYEAQVGVTEDSKNNTDHHSSMALEPTGHRVLPLIEVVLPFSNLQHMTYFAQLFLVADLQTVIAIPTLSLAVSILCSAGPLATVRDISPAWTKSLLVSRRIDNHSATTSIGSDGRRPCYAPAD